MNEPKIKLKDFSNLYDEFPLWKYTIWDKRFNEVDNWKQPKVISYPYMLANNLESLKKNKGNVFLLSTGSFSGYTTEDMAGRYLCDGEVVSIPWGGTANVKYVKGLFVTADNRIATSSDTDVLANKYLYYLLVSKTHILNSFYRGASIKHPSMADVLDMKLHIPSPKEQETIVSFFSKIDELIIATGERVASLKQIKAASLQAMFPQEGESTPRLRFKGFTEDWQKVPLSDCLEISDERNIKNEFGINEVLSVSDEEGVKNQIKLLGRSYAGKSVTNYKVLRSNQVVYTKSPLKAKPYGIIKVNNGETGIVSVLYAVYNTKDGVSPDYIHYYFEPTFRINNYLLPLINKGAKNTMNISDEASLQGYIVIPKSLDEQCKIVKLFQSIDRQIALQEQRLEKLKRIKTACLDKMFV